MNGITVVTTITASGEAPLTLNQSFTVEAYDKVNFVLGGLTSRTIAVQPGSNPGDVPFLAIMAGVYNGAVTYSVDGGPSVVLNAPHIFTGTGQVALLSDTPNAFTFTNSQTQTVAIQVLCGRSANP
ncbi:MAG: hypothetical protein LUQ53_04255 [Methanothrix sp.]|jgi:hypothetical protein|nr:hypothetical protein [Methanothrix sp.]